MMSQTNIETRNILKDRSLQCLIGKNNLQLVRKMSKKSKRSTLKQEKKKSILEYNQDIC